MNQRDIAVGVFKSLSQNNMDPMERHTTPDCQITFSGNPQPLGLTEVKAFVPAFNAAFTDYRFTFEDVIAADGKVVMRCRNRARHTGEWMGLPPTGNEIDYEEIIITHFEGDRIARVWIQHDDILMMQQLGMTLAPATA